ncbi:MAG: hypothetical protein Q7U80_00605 [Thiobacillus sp.]|nr:hypothetical protein [Thiobacillus sp.]MDP3124348.1 hypothetical protein [Thiobacillus sp.]
MTRLSVLPERHSRQILGESLGKSEEKLTLIALVIAYLVTMVIKTAELSAKPELKNPDGNFDGNLGQQKA